MHNILNQTKTKAVLFFLFTLFSCTAFCQEQTPSQQQINEVLPTLSPTQMTKSGFENYFKDNNRQKNPGSDKNKETPEIRKRLENKTLEKDSTQNDNIKKNNFAKYEETYGANIFQNAAMNDVSELSTPPSDYPIGVGDHIIVSLWGGGEYQED